MEAEVVGVKPDKRHIYRTLMLLLQYFIFLGEKLKKILKFFDFVTALNLHQICKIVRMDFSKRVFRGQQCI